MYGRAAGIRTVRPAMPFTGEGETLHRALCHQEGQRKVLAGLCHEFESAVLPSAVRRGGYDSLWGSPCFVFHEPLGFGVEATSVREAYDQLSLEDGWLILLRDASAGIHRPEARWDDEKLIG